MMALFIPPKELLAWIYWSNDTVHLKDDAPDSIKDKFNEFKKKVDKTFENQLNINL